MSISPEELKDLKEKIDNAKNEKARAEGAIQQIETDWKENHDCKNEEEVKALIKELESQVETFNTKLEEYTTEIEKVMGEE